MASINIPDEDRTITDPEDIRAFLAPFGIWYEKWDVDSRIGTEASNEEILDAFAPEIERLKEKGGFVTADVINVTAETPNLDAMLAEIRQLREQTLAALVYLTEDDFSTPTAMARWTSVRRVLLRFGDHMREHINQISGARAAIEREHTMPQRILAEAELAQGNLLAATVGRTMMI